MKKAAKPAAPRGLSTGGRALWRSVIAAYDLRPDEYRVLEIACQTADMVETLTEALVGQPLTLPGVKDQPRTHPLIVELRQQRIALASLLKQLKLPEESGETRSENSATSRSARARSAANARWHVAGSGIGGAS